MSSPFHAGEQWVQSRAGMREKAEQIGSRVIRSFMPDQHREFFAQLPALLVAAVDREGQPHASVLWGTTGFAWSPHLNCFASVPTRRLMIRLRHCYAPAPWSVCWGWSGRPVGATG